MQPKIKRLYVLVLSATTAGWLWLLWNWNNYDQALLTGKLMLCPFRAVTGYPCPSCGTTHSVLQIFHSHPAAAFYSNPLGFIIAACMIIFPVWIIADLISKKERFFTFYRNTEAFIRIRWVAVILTGVVIINWAWSLYKYSL